VVILGGSIPLVELKTSSTAEGCAGITTSASEATLTWQKLVVVGKKAKPTRETLKSKCFSD